MTVDGSDDSKILSEGLEEYHVPPPSIIEPTLLNPVTIDPETATSFISLKFKMKMLRRISQRTRTSNSLSIWNRSQSSNSTKK